MLLPLDMYSTVSFHINLAHLHTDTLTNVYVRDLPFLMLQMFFFTAHHNCGIKTKSAAHEAIATIVYVDECLCTVCECGFFTFVLACVRTRAHCMCHALVCQQIGRYIMQGSIYKDLIEFLLPLCRPTTLWLIQPRIAASEI